MRIPIIILKNIKLLLRSRTSSLIIIFGPLLIILFVGMAFNTSGLYGINIGTFSESYSELTNSTIGVLEDKQFNIIRTDPDTGSQDECIEKVRIGDYHVCIYFPPDLNIKNLDQDTIVFYVDPSRINLVYTILGEISDKINLKSTELSKGLTQTLLDTINKAKVEVVGKKDTLTDLNSRNDQVQSDVQEIADAGASLNFRFNISDLNISGIRDECDKVNCTFRGLINDLELNLDEITDDLEKASGAESTITNKSDQVKTAVTQSKEDLSTVTQSINSLSDTINNIKITEAESIVNPIKTEIKPITAEEKTLSFLFPTLLVLVVMLISVLFSSLVVVREKSTKAYFRNFITPTSNFILLISIYLTNIIILLFQLLIIFGVAYYFFRNEIVSVLLNASLALLVIATLFILLGMVIGYFFISVETAALAAVAISSILLLFSNAILPLETLPLVFKKIAVFNPFVISENLLRRLILFESSLSDVTMLFVYLLVFIVTFFILAFIAMQLTKRRIS